MVALNVREAGVREVAWDGENDMSERVKGA